MAGGFRLRTGELAGSRPAWTAWSSSGTRRPVGSFPLSGSRAPVQRRVQPRRSSGSRPAPPAAMTLWRRGDVERVNRTVSGHSDRRRRGVQPRRQCRRRGHIASAGVEVVIGRRIRIADGRAVGDLGPQRDRTLGRPRRWRSARTAAGSRWSSTGGRLVRIGGDDRRACLASSGHAIRRRCAAWPSAPTAGGSPRPAGTERSILWDAEVGSVVRIHPGHTGFGIQASDFSPDGRWLASAGDDGPSALGGGDRPRRSSTFEA